MGLAISVLVILVVAFLWIAAIVFWIAVVAFGRLDGWIDKVLKRCPPNSPTITDIDIPHRLGKPEPQRRLRVTEACYAVGKVLGGSALVVEWEENRAYFAVWGTTGYFEFGDDNLRIHAAICESAPHATQAIVDSLRRFAEGLVASR